MGTGRRNEFLICEKLNVLIKLTIFSQVANLQEDSEAAAGDSERVKELQNEIAAVNEKVVHYQTVLADTVSSVF